VWSCVSVFGVMIMCVRCVCVRVHHRVCMCCVCSLCVCALCVHCVTSRECVLGVYIECVRVLGVYMTTR